MMYARKRQAAWIFSERVLKHLLNVVAKMSDCCTAACGFDLCGNVLSADFDITKLFPALKSDEKWNGVQEVISKLRGPV
jgi:hypothetical protein